MGTTLEQQKENKRLAKNAKIAKTLELTNERPAKVERLRQAFSIGANIEMACRYAGINKTTYYEWIKNDEQLANDLASFRDQPILKSLKTVVGSLDQPGYAFKYLEKKLPDEYGEKSTIKHEGKIETENTAETKGIEEAVQAFNEHMRIVLTKRKEIKSNDNDNKKREATDLGQRDSNISNKS